MDFISKSIFAVSLSLILGSFKLFAFPLGGSVTLGKFVPLIYLSYECGVKVGVFASLACGFLHFLISPAVPPAKSFLVYCLLVLLDYILPYIVFGLSPLFDFFKSSNRLKMYTGATASFILKIFVCTISGAVLWGEYIPCGEAVWLYSLVYNSSYLIPEWLISLFMISKLKKFFSFTNSYHSA